MSHKLKILFLVFLLLPFVILAQNTQAGDNEYESIKIPELKLEKYKNNPDFDYEIAVDQANIIVRAIDWIKRQIKKILYQILMWIFGAKEGGKIFQLLLRALPYLAVLLFVYLLFKFLIGMDLIKLDKKSNYKLNKVYLSEDEQIIQEEDIEKLILKAIENKNYRLATRYYYLRLLKKLKEAGLIQWNADKTNREYLQELKNSDLKPLFKNLTFIYDYVWYGNYNPEEEDFQKIKNDFNSFSV